MRDQTDRIGRPALIVLAGLALLFGIKLVLAARLPLFGDEAFYWLESRHPALGYSDLPFLTALLVRAGTMILGDSYLGVRLWFLVFGTLLPVPVWFLARYLADARAAWWAAGATACVPLAAMLGVLALPDVPLVVLGLSGLLAFTLAVEGRHRLWWLMAGLFAALGLCAHYRFAALIAGPLIYLVAAPVGRRWLATPWPWMAAFVAAWGLVPVVWFNLNHDFAGLAFQFVERHPWEFRPEGWRFLPVQVMVVTPLMFAALAGALVAGVRHWRREPAAGPIVLFSIVLIVGFALSAFFADTERTTAHWPLAGYLPLLAWLPAVLSRWPHWVRWLPAATGAAGTLLMAGYLAVAIWPTGLGGLTSGKAFPDNFAGWPEAARGAAERLAGDDDPVVVAGNFMLAAELAFELERQGPVYSLEHVLNRRHGRSLQLSLWNLDEGALARRESGRRALVVLEESTLKIGDQPSWVRRVCRFFDEVDFSGELSLAEGRKRFLYFTATVRSRPAPAPTSAIATKRCDLPPHAYLIEPRPGDVIDGPVRVFGWAVEDNRGVAEVALLVDGKVAGSTRSFYSYPDVGRFLPGSVDPTHPRVGFEVQWDPSGLPPGRHDVAVRVTTKDGNVRTLENRSVRIQP